MRPVKDAAVDAVAGGIRAPAAAGAAGNLALCGDLAFCEQPLGADHDSTQKTHLTSGRGLQQKQAQGQCWVTRTRNIKDHTPRDMNSTISWR